MAFYKSKYTGAEIDQRLAQGTYDDALMRGFDGTKEDFDILLAKLKKTSDLASGSQQYEDDRLETINKTVVNAINELHTELQSKSDKGELEEECNLLDSKITTVNNNLVESINTINKNVNDSLIIVNQAVQQNAETIVAEIEQRKEADTELSERVETLENAGYATKEELNDYALKSELPKQYIVEEGTTLQAGDEQHEFNIKSSGRVTINDDKIVATVDQIQVPYEINLTNLLSAEDSESISTAIGGIDNLNATVQDNRIIVGTISNGSVSVSIRILGNVTTLYYLLDSVVGLTLNEIAITNTSGTLSKSVTTHSVLTENMVINSLNSDETTLPLSAAQGKALNTYKQDKTDDTLDTEDKTVVGAINEILSKATGVGKVDPKSYCGEIFNLYKHPFGSPNRATGDYSHAEGYKTIASGTDSHAEGYNNTASGMGSHVEGGNNEAIASQSHVEGFRNRAFTANEHAEGMYNKSYDSTDVTVRVIHSVGIGSSQDLRKNAHEIKLNGDHYVYGLGNFDGTNSADAQTLQEVVNSKQATITAGTGLEFEGNTLNVTLDTNVFFVTDATPETPTEEQKKKICLVPADTTEEGNYYTEYVWVVNDEHPDGYWEEFGTYKSEVDLTPYLKITDAAATYLTKVDAADTYQPKGEYQPAGDYATNTALTQGLEDKQDKGDYALKSELPSYTIVPELTADYTVPANATTREFIYQISVGETVYSILGAEGIKWANDVAPVIYANKTYVVSVINNLAVWGEF